MSFTILLPPSRGMEPGGDGPGWNPGSGRFGDVLGAYRREVAEELAIIGGGDASMLGLNGDRYEAAATANREVVGSPTLPASHRYTGVVFGAMDPPTLPDLDGLVVVSALLGFASLTDPVPEYRLAGGDSVGRLGRLRGHWPSRLADAYDSLVPPIIDLTSLEYLALLPPDTERVRVDLVAANGKRAGHWGKVAKGRLVRRLVTSGGDPFDVIASFLHEGVTAVVG